MSYVKKGQGTGWDHYLERTSLDPNKKEVRLLIVAPGAADDTISCKTQVSSLLEVPVYEAVSYAWSHVTGSKTIVVDDASVKVPAAAEEVLRHLRYSDRPRTLWIDAICINQRDNTERSHQVVLMHEIYRKTSRTVIWLGESDSSTAAAFSSLKLIHDQMCTESENGQELREVLYGKSNIFQYSTTKLPNDCDFAALRTFYERTWFGRLWVVQEAALCTSGIVVCGKYEMGLIELMRASV